MTTARKWVPAGIVFFALFWLVGSLLRMPHPLIGAVITTPLWCVLMSWLAPNRRQGRSPS